MLAVNKPTKGFLLAVIGLFTGNIYGGTVEASTNIEKSGKHVVCLHVSPEFHEANKSKMWSLTVNLHKNSGQLKPIVFQPPFLATTSEGSSIHYCEAAEFKETGLYQYSHQAIKGIQEIGFNHVSFKK